MKKIIILSILILITAGCGKKSEDFSCSYTVQSDGKEYITKVEVKVQENNVIDATAYLTFNDDEFAQSMCSMLSSTSDAEGNLECDGRNITIKNYHKSLSNETFTKDKLIKYLEDLNYSCTNN